MRSFSTLLLALAACGGSDGAKPDAAADAMSDSATRDAGVDAGADAAAACPQARTIATATAATVAVANDPGAAMGVFDPSVIYPQGAPGGAMAYSAVPDQHSIRTRIALSADAGATWTFVAEANAPEAAAIASSDAAECPTGTCTGALISEVPSLVFDPGDAQWKLFAHRYLVEPNDALHYRIGTITMQTAAQPQGPWSAPVKLIGWPSPAAYTTDQVRTTTTALGMDDCLALTEPAGLVTAAGLDLAMGCIYLAGGAPKIRVVRAHSDDHGATWTGAGTLLAPGAADCLPGTAAGASVNAPDLFVGADGKTYLSVTSSDAAGYHGCVVYEVGQSAPAAMIVTDTGQFSGACTWSAGGGGWLADVLYGGQPRFRIARAGP